MANSGGWNMDFEAKFLKLQKTEQIIVNID
jgi:hypothetical protein